LYRQNCGGDLRLIMAAGSDASVVCLGAVLAVSWWAGGRGWLLVTVGGAGIFGGD
jgi:hypothetical protein